MTSPDTPPSGQPDPAALLALGLATQATDADASSAPPPDPAALAAEFPQLEILELIGRGGMGAVYKARQRDLDRLVALKILRPGLDADPGFSERFTREARALAQLNHPGIVTLYEFGKTSAGRYFIFMEFVDGVNLRQLLAAGRLSPREALAIVPPLCDALQYAHDRGLIHRDIKPENILVDRLGRVKIADFGLARLASEGRDGPPGRPSENTAPDLTLAGQIMGTPRYMAPEQRERPTEVDHRADLYALGVVFYQMLTGELPDEKLLRPPSAHVKIDVRLDEIVLRALEKNPALRYAAASELKTRIETLGSAPPPVVTAPEKKPLLPLVERHDGKTRILWRNALIIWGFFIGATGVCMELGHLLSNGLFPGPDNFIMLSVVGTGGFLGQLWLAQKQLNPLDKKLGWRLVAALLAVGILGGIAASLKKNARTSALASRPAANIASATPTNASATPRFTFGRAREITLPRSNPVAYDFDRERFVDYTPTPQSPHGIEASQQWHLDHGTDIFADPNSHLPGVLFLGTDLAEASADLWDAAAAEAQRHSGQPNRGLMTFIAAPALGQPSATRVYRTREGGVFLVQVIGATDARAVRLRYKAVLPASAPVDANDPPRLRALDWLDHVEGCVGEAWLPTGENAPEKEWRPPITGVSNATLPLGSDAPRYLCLWFSHPAFDRLSVVDVSFLNPDTHEPLPAGNVASGFNDGQPPQDSPHWLTVTASPGTFGKLPERVEIQLRYSGGEWHFWDELPAGFNGRKALANGVSIGGPGQNADGHAFIELARDTTHDTQVEQFDFVALTPDGRRLERNGHSRTTTDATTIERFMFDAPLSQVRAFEIRKRPINSAIWTAVLHPERILSDQRSLRFDRAGDTMQNIVQRLRRDHALRLSFENLDFTTADAVTLGARLHDLEAKAAEALLQDAEVRQLRDARRLRNEEKLGEDTLIDVGTRYTGSIYGNTVAEFFDHLTAGTPYVARKMDDTWLIQPRTGSVLTFPVTLKTSGLTVDEAVRAILAQSPAAKPIGTGIVFAMPVARGTDPTPWLSVRAPALDFNLTPANEALCRLTASARPASVWELSGYHDARMLNISSAPADKSLPVINSAQTWLVKVDRGDYAPGWDDASTAFRAATPKQNWIAALARVRAPLGETKSRQLRSVAFAQKLPGAPDGRYLVMQFSTRFAALTDAVETVTLSLEPDGEWRASGYFIKPAAAATFDPVVERTWTTSGARLTGLLDLDTGREFALAQLYVDQGPSTELVDLATRQALGKINLDDIESAGLARHKIDLVGSREKKTGVLVGIGMTVVPVGHAAWSDLSAEDIGHAPDLATPLASAPAQTTLDGADTWLFLTREGSRGILQIVERTENPRALRFRYKRVRTSSSARQQDSPPAAGSISTP